MGGYRDESNVEIQPGTVGPQTRRGPGREEDDRSAPSIPVRNPADPTRPRGGPGRRRFRAFPLTPLAEAGFFGGFRPAVLRGGFL